MITTKNGPRPVIAEITAVNHNGWLASFSLTADGHLCARVLEIIERDAGRMQTDGQTSGTEMGSEAFAKIRDDYETQLEALRQHAAYDGYNQDVTVVDDPEAAWEEHNRLLAEQRAPRD